MEYTRFFEDLNSKDVKKVGGKNASLGEMFSHLKKEGITVPNGFATTADAYWEFLNTNDLKPKITEEIEKWRKGKVSLEECGKTIRKWMMKGEFSPEFRQAILEGYEKLGKLYGKSSVDVAVRSSATAEDLPSASFAGQHDTYLDIKGKKELLHSCKQCLASLFTNRAIVYRENHGFDHMRVALSVGIQKMVRSDKWGAGVMFTLDTETGFPNIVLINATWGLGEMIVQGEINPDQYIVLKPLLDDPSKVPIIECKIGSKKKKMIYGKKDTKTVKCTPKEQKQSVLNKDEILQLARWAKKIEEHYGMPMDLEWAKDGQTSELFIVQARPETVQSAKAKQPTIRTYIMQKKGKKLLEGLSVGEAIAEGKVCKLKNAKQIQKFKEGSILVTQITDPDWVPIMKKASAIITDHGGRTSHAAIVSREIGVPAIVGTEKGTRVLKDGQQVTVSCAEGDTGFIYEGKAEYKIEDIELKSLPKTKVELMLNLADPSTAMKWWPLPSKGVGLARMEFIVSNHIQIHPMALVNWDRLKDKRAKKKIAELTEGYKDKKDYFIEKLAYGIAKIAAVHHPHPVIVRLSDFKTNEYSQLIGGAEFEPEEENPMLGWRGASRYYHPDYEPGFALECRAIKKVREEIGLKNVKVMIPFCRTLEEADDALGSMKKHGLSRGEEELEVYVMCEIPSNVILAEEFAQKFDGFSIGSNDLTQLTLGVDRDSDRIANLFNEFNPAVQKMIRKVVETALKEHCHIGFCGQAPSNHPEFARFLTETGINAISVTPDSFLTVLKNIAQEEQKLKP